MNLVKVDKKNIELVKLKDVAVDVEYQNGYVSRIKLEDMQGSSIVFERSESYGDLKCYVPAPKEIAKRYRVSWTIDGETYHRDIEDEWEAKQLLAKVELHDSPKMEQVEVEI